MDKHDEWSAEESLDSVDSTTARDSSPASLSPLFGPADLVVARYCHCAECGAHLHFSHVTDFSRNLTQESAKCPECGTKGREGIYKLQ